MANSKTFNPNHRIRSASAVFQKGIYHLFALKYSPNIDVFSKVLRSYQCTLYLCIVLFLLDKEKDVTIDHIEKRLKNLCNDRQSPNPDELDPAAVVKHSYFELRDDGKSRCWQGFNQDHCFQDISQKVLNLNDRLVEARHELMYRPLLTEQAWEDCRLMSFLEGIPNVEDIEEAYTVFFNAAMENYQLDRWIDFFIERLFVVFEDRNKQRPTETLLLTYARMMDLRVVNSLDETLKQLAEYRNNLICIHKLKECGIYVPEEYDYEKV